ncbi:MAG: ATP-binding protein [Sphingobium sp.]|uniref:ATP-binding protein n=1 Tax=Sphingobium sp. TaxID=1912891 RepID=UPI0029ACF244|nr:ATP-binding protein [Sphingobium sp.]MDX3909704.1 ATP-binding protein [Sphingobium sp.]
MNGDLTDSRYWPGWRMLLALGGAMLLPVLIYALVTIGIQYRQDRYATEAATLDRASAITERVDARLNAVAFTIRALATIRSIRERRWDEARARSAEISALDPDWRGVTLIELETGKRLFDFHTADRTSVGLESSAARRIASASRGQPTFSSIVDNPSGDEIHAYLGIGAGEAPTYLLDVTLDPRMIQRILLATAPENGVSAVVDRNGLFIARTKAWPARLGTPATTYLRDAIATGTKGLYKGVTWEGLESYSAFATSPDTGWSSHVAVSSTLIDKSNYTGRLALIAAGFACLLLASLLIILLLRLIADRRSADLRQQQSERLETVGKLTGGVAHDFNNMLAIVIGSLDLALRKLAKGDADIVRYLDNAMEGANRAADLTRRLLAFSRRQPLAPVIVDINALIIAMRELLQRTLAADIRIVTQLATDLWPASVDPGQLENALVNLAINARDAMPDGGTLTITTRNLARRSRDGGSDMVEIAVTDTGTGMSPEVAARAFEPFYTTKEVGRGTGLGLSQIHGFVTQSGGTATLHSTPGEGTTVRLLLPRHHQSEQEATAHTIKQDQTAPSGRREEIILVVEDEELVRRTNVEALRSLGYTVRHAANADEALAVLDKQPGVKLLLSDIVMPGMNGRDLADRVAQRFPGMRIVLVTGFERDKVSPDEERILRKPFGVGELARRVRSELDLAA